MGKKLPQAPLRQQERRQAHAEQAAQARPAPLVARLVRRSG